MTFCKELFNLSETVVENVIWDRHRSTITAAIPASKQASLKWSLGTDATENGFTTFLH